MDVWIRTVPPAWTDTRDLGSTSDQSRAFSSRTKAVSLVFKQARGFLLQCVGTKREAKLSRGAILRNVNAIANFVSLEISCDANAANKVKFTIL